MKIQEMVQYDGGNDDTMTRARQEPKALVPLKADAGWSKVLSEFKILYQMILCKT